MHSHPFVVIFHEFTHVGGGQTFVSNLYRALKPIWGKVEVVTGSKALKKWQFKNKKQTAVLLANIYTPKLFWQLIWWVIRGKKLVIMIHGIWYREWQSRLGRSNWLGWETWRLCISQGILFLLADELVVCSKYSLFLVETSFPFGRVLSKKITIIPGLIEATTSTPPLQSDEVETKLVLKPRNQTFLAVGRLERRKGFDFLIEAFGKVAKKQTQVRLTLVLDLGPTSQIELLPGLIETIQVAGCENRVELIINPSKSVLGKLFGESDAFVMSSIELETFGFVTLEALQLGLPVVGFATSATPEVVGDDIADAFLTKTISASALAQKMTQWLQLSEVQKQEWRVLSMLRSRVFDSQIQAAQWTRLFEKYA